ncbi:MAG TPA: chromosomal replication initiator protein DnaA [Bryobacteraceae bacterium]|nr:chromosomal replication initiator protein DnaA [Bryobacteraceae bacterium]
MNPWDRIKKHLETKLSSESYQNWISRTALAGVDGDVLIVTVPDESTRRWMESEYAAIVVQAGQDAGVAVARVEYVLPMREQAELEAAPSSSLNPKFTFESFVVGACNQFAAAAAKAVADNPSRRYNPLFIYGGVGMGKTHLMHAIGRSLIDNHATMRIVYISSERFMNDMITCIRLDRMPQFHERYRSADVLLVDDIQLIGNKDRTQEEFFHTFNELHDHQKQIVISSDSPPKDIPGLIDRLRSRFEWGLMADIQPPDLETKMAILDKKAEAEGVALPEEVRTFMATKMKGNVRELEGALVKLVAYSSLTGSSINMQMTQQVLRHLVFLQDRKITIDSIQKAVAERYGIRQSQLKEKSNTKKIVEPRQVAMYLVKELTTASLPEIGRVFGGKHHTTVLHSIKKIDKLRQTDPELNRIIHALIDSLQ